ncbi:MULTISPECIES: hypothetical protein [Brevibacillus]|uniref:hypothetical protein n=1 Tax=Brevibacillus TaxID=55080 RepID=UPI0025B65AB1|nr:MULTISPECIES: hypothetical protein [Brevibacillus]MDN4095615.1 hypothetical protein [Brevibacillus agri]MDR9507017.1 hypothetical protein [Brevibacillus agri]WNF05548.1 hypothetical protein RFB14_25005 [Brevibacillus borstelensis]
MVEKSSKSLEGNNQVVTKQEFEVLKKFLYQSEPDSHYPDIQENEKLYYVLAGMVVRQLLEKKYERYTPHKIGEFINIRSLEQYKERLGFLLEHSLHLINQVDYTSPIAKSLYVLFNTDTKCLSKDHELKNYYKIGLFTNHIRIV